MSTTGTDEYYFGPSYEFTNYVTTLSALPRFGHGRDFTTLFSSNQEAQLDYGAGLISLFICSLLFFIFLTIIILTFKILGPRNAGFLSGHHFIIIIIVKDDNNNNNAPSKEIEENEILLKKNNKALFISSAVRIIFITATACLFLSSFLLQKGGITNANNAAYIMTNSLITIENLLKDAKHMQQI